MTPYHVARSKLFVRERFGLDDRDAAECPCIAAGIEISTDVAAEVIEDCRQIESLSHLHSLMVAMSQKSSVPQAAIFSLTAPMSDKALCTSLSIPSTC
jgi:hypothetical protein